MLCWKIWKRGDQKVNLLSSSFAGKRKTVTQPPLQQNWTPLSSQHSLLANREHDDDDDEQQHPRWFAFFYLQGKCTLLEFLCPFQYLSVKFEPVAKLW